MKLFPALEQEYTRERRSAREAQRLAQFIAFGPIIFQVSRLMIKFGILDLLRDSDQGLTLPELAEKSELSTYALEVLLEASLSIGTVLIDPESERFSLSKTGWFLLTDPSTRVNIDFNHDVNYEGWFHLEESLKEERPAGLAHFGPWKTVYEGLAQLPEPVRNSWFAFDHFYSDHSFDEALPILFERPIRHLLDVGGNTVDGALRCVAYNPQVEVTILDLPQQLELMRAQITDQPGAERIHATEASVGSEHGLPERTDIRSDLDESVSRLFRRNGDPFDPRTCRPNHAPRYPSLYHGNVLGSPEVRTRHVVPDPDQPLFYGHRQRQQQMYHSEQMQRLVESAGLQVETIHDFLGWGHSIMVCKK